MTCSELREAQVVVGQGLHKDRQWHRNVILNFPTISHARHEGKTIWTSRSLEETADIRKTCHGCLFRYVVLRQRSPVKWRT